MPSATSSERRLYCDSSALVKLIVAEEESVALRAFVDGHSVVTSELSLTEVPRAIRGRKLGETALRSAASLFEDLDFVQLTQAVLVHAARYSEPALRSLDAIHLASAEQSASSHGCFVSYDRRQVRMASAVGLITRSPS